MTDVTSFLTLGDVFTSAMTGNTALLGIALSQGRILSATHSFSALVGFSLGASLAAALYLKYLRRPNRPGSLAVIRPLLLTELICLGLFAAILTLAGSPGENVVLYALILLSAIGMGIQGVAARHINSPGINTIVFTSTLVSIAVSLTGLLMDRSGGDNVRSDTKRQIWAFLAYGLGALLAGILAGPAPRVAAWIPILAVVAALGCYEAAARAERSTA